MNSLIVLSSALLLGVKVGRGAIGDGRVKLVTFTRHGAVTLVG